MASETSISDRVWDAARRLAGCPVRSISPVRNGANGRVFRIETAAGPLALKQYVQRRGDSRPRAANEWRALTFLAGRNLAATPFPVARDPHGEFLLMEWIDGEPVTTHCEADLEQAADFLIRVFALSSEPGAAKMPLASEACLSAADIIEQIERRLASLAPEPVIAAFLSEAFRPIFARALGGLDSAQETGRTLEPALRRLIPADFGFHNALRLRDGTLRYIDLEYFGWDDPVKVTADFLLHPAMRLTDEERCGFAARIAAALPHDVGFEARLRRHLPFFALRWILIVFNPFRADRTDDLPSDGQARENLLHNRLAKASALLEWAVAAIPPP